MEGISSHDCPNAIVSSHINNYLDLGMQHSTPSSQPVGTPFHLSTGHSKQSRAKKDLSIMYFNARSLLPKLDALWRPASLTSFTLLNPGCVMTLRTRRLTFLATLSIASTGIVIVVDCNVHRQSPRCESHSWPAVQPGVFLQYPLDLLTISFVYVFFYRPPSSHSSLLDIFSQSLETLDISQFSNFVCVGDFNIDYNDSALHLYPKLSSISQLLGLSQAVTGYTHVSPSGHTSLIDLVLVTSPHHVHDCFVIPPLANSDHLGLHINLDFKPLAQPKCSRSYARAIWRYSHADFPLAQQRIRGRAFYR